MASTTTTALMDVDSSSNGGVRSNEVAAPNDIRKAKRKFDEALHSLDEVLDVAQNSTVSHPPPTKKTKLQSIYSTLSKYGIRSKGPPQDSQSTEKDASSQNVIQKLAPHLASIISRSKTRGRKDAPFTAPITGSISTSSLNSSLPSFSAEYRPSSLPSFLDRLSTFKLTTYSNKPVAIDAVAAAKCGWINEGKDRLACGMCKSSWIIVGREGMNRDAANALVEKQRQGLVDNHKDSCPWKVKQCDPTIYRIPLKMPAVMAREIKSRAIELHAHLDGIEVRHPLSTSQVHTVISTLSSIPLSSPVSRVEEDAPSPSQETAATNPSVLPVQEVSDSATLAALFGWTLVPSRPSSTCAHTSVSRAGTPTPSSSRARSVTPSFTISSSADSSPPRNESINRTSIAGPSTIPFRPMLSRAVFEVQAKKTADQTLVECALCQRRVGLWAFKEGIPDRAPSRASTSTPLLPTAAPRTRQFDLLKEHRSYCPYVVRSTAVPSLNATPSHSSNPSTTSIPRSLSFLAPSKSTSTLALADEKLLEGWKAIIAVISRYGLTRKQRQRALRRLSSSAMAILGGGEGSAEGDVPMEEDEGESQELDGIAAMIEGVKSNGSKDIVKYVKSLLG